uniref:Uncharacterized protein n=1 Tax=Anguilla anguilla TaxID=7936 RepID=A0A0E9SQ65_ANGAN
MDCIPVTIYNQALKTLDSWKARSISN